MSSCSSPSTWQETANTEGLSPDLFGTWKTVGYGWAFEIERDNVAAYDLDDAGCIRDSSFTTEDFRDWLRVFKQDTHDRLRLTTDPDVATQFVFEHMEQIPATCSVPVNNSPKGTFDYAWKLMDEHYAFFDVYGIDWQKRYTEFAPAVSDATSDDSLFTLLEHLVEGINDGHLVITGEVEGNPRRYRGKGAELFRSQLAEGFEQQSEYESFGAFADAWFGTNRQFIQQEILDSTTVSSHAENGMFWGRRGEVGYLFIAGMGADRYGDTQAEQISNVHETLNQVLSELSDCKALILDLTFNQGGSDFISYTIASHFTDRPQVALSKFVHGAKEETLQTYNVLPREGTRFLKPVAVLTSSVTLSAAETFTIMMRGLPNVQQAGAPTRGALSDVLFKSLPNGWTLRLSNEVYLDAEGVLWEGTGVEPHLPLPMFSDGLDGHTEAIQALIEQLQ